MIISCGFLCIHSGLLLQYYWLTNLLTAIILLPTRRCWCTMICIWIIERKAWSSRFLLQCCIKWGNQKAGSSDWSLKFKKKWNLLQCQSIISSMGKENNFSHYIPEYMFRKNLKDALEKTQYNLNLLFFFLSIITLRLHLLFSFR